MDFIKVLVLAVAIGAGLGFIAGAIVALFLLLLAHVMPH